MEGGEPEGWVGEEAQELDILPASEHGPPYLRAGPEFWQVDILHGQELFFKCVVMLILSKNMRVIKSIFLPFAHGAPFGLFRFSFFDVEASGLDVGQRCVYFWVLQLVVLVQAALGPVGLVAVFDSAFVKSFDFMCVPPEALVLLLIPIVGTQPIFFLNQEGQTSYLLSLLMRQFFSSTSYLTWAVSAILARYSRTYSW